jgi:hypothetical protein
MCCVLLCDILARVNLAQAMALIVPPVTNLKQRALTRSDGEHTMFPTVVALRDDRVLCVVTTPRMAVTLACAHTLAVGLAPQALALAAQVQLDDGGEAISYTVMSRERSAGFAVQPYAVRDGSLLFGTPEKGTPQDRGLMDELARAMSHAPLDATRVSRKDGADSAANPSFLPEDEGRMALDSGTCASLQSKVAGVRGTTLYLARDGEHATRLLAHGMPQEVLLR